MGKRIVVNAGVTETRLAVQDGNLLTELYVERADRRSIVGNIYKGVVTNVLPGMQAAFVDIGLTKDAFLYAGDYTANLGAEDQAGAARGGRAPTWTRARAKRTDRGRARAAPAGGRAHRGDAAQGPGGPGAGLEGVARHQGRAGHLLRLHPGPLHRLHAPVAPRRRVAPHPRRRGAGPAPRHRQGAARRRPADSSCGPSRRARARRSWPPTSSS